MSPPVSVIIPNWNGHHLLTGCLAALRAQTFRDFEIIVVDNGSHDGSVAWLADRAPDVIVVRNEVNLGFAVANNQGFRAAQAPLLVALNNDALPEPDWLRVLVETAERETWAGMLACRILRRDPAGVIDSLGIEVDRAGMAWNRAWGQPQTDRLVDRPCEVFGPSGAAALYRRTMLDQIGLFDEDLFAYYEDVDLAWRAQWAGWRCLYVPGAIVHHIHSATSQPGSSFKTRLLGRNKWWVIAKNYPFASLWYYLPAMLVLDLGAALVTSIRGRNLAALQGRGMALRGWGKMWRKRSQFQRSGMPAAEWRQRLVAVQLARWRAA